MNDNQMANQENITQNDLIVRDYLARQRTHLANERTLLSYIRTSLYFLVSGTALLEVKALAHVARLGYVAFGLCLLLLVLGIVNFLRVRGKMKNHYYQQM
jgi:putative membrane protein